MSRRRFGDADALIQDLLDRYEAKPGANRLMAYIDEESFPSVEARDRFTASLMAAEQSGGVGIQRRKIEGSVILGYIYLADAAALYAHAGRIPARAKVEAALGVAQARADLPLSARQLLDEIADAWARGVGSHGLIPHDDASLNSVLNLAQALHRRACVPTAAPIDFRTFSRASGCDSKALDRLGAIVARIFLRLYPEAGGQAGLKADDLLASLGIVRTPQPFMISGPIIVAGTPMPSLQFFGIPPEQGELITLSAPIDHVLTIENYTSFVRHVRETGGERGGLVIYTGGFPARAHLANIVRLARLARAPIYHWGDLDGGGVRIFHHLARSLESYGIQLRPHLMDVSLLRQHGISGGRPLRQADRPNRDSPIFDLWEALNETGLVVEQETLAPVLPGTKPRA